MQVYSTDDRVIGAIDHIEDKALVVNGRRIAESQIARVAQGRVYLKGVYNELTGSMQADTATVNDRDTVRVPVYEERLNVDKREVEAGEVTIHKTVESEEVSVPIELRREEVNVQQHDVADRPVEAAALGEAFQERTIRVPVRGEEAVVDKQAYVTGEVEINKQQTVDRQEVHDTVRRERVDIDDAYQRLRPEFEKSFNERMKAGSTGKRRTFEQTEPYYRYGLESGADERYAGRSFEDAEPHLRQDYQSRFGKSGDPWEELRQDIQEAYNRSRR